MSIDNEPQIQEIDSDDSGDESTNIHNPSGKTLNRAEKKTRKAISKLGLKPYDGSASGTGKIIRVTVKKQKNILFVISNPDVYKSPSDNSTFIVFGEARIEDLSSSNNALRGLANAGKAGGGAGPNAAAMANLMQAMGGLGGAAGASGAGAGGALGALPDSGETEPSSSEDKKEEKSSGGGKSGSGSSDVKVEDKDIELVVTQVGCTKEKAIAALKKHNNDIVEAIMSFNV